ncbi:hypothetical protein SESBI_14924 [Sesbania bispinosa]|nr:hypothetical protein SESBI_14924 [Sesbania bispinosa]
MEVQSPAVKRHYDITMSRRTRKQSFPVQANEKPISVDDMSQQTSLPEVKESENDHKSLKQLIRGEEKLDAVKCNNNDEGGKGTHSLGEHFNEEEKQLQLVRLQLATERQPPRFEVQDFGASLCQSFGAFDEG